MVTRAQKKVFEIKVALRHSLLDAHQDKEEETIRWRRSILALLGKELGPECRDAVKERFTSFLGNQGIFVYAVNMETEKVVGVVTFQIPFAICPQLSVGLIGELLVSKEFLDEAYHRRVKQDLLDEVLHLAKKIAGRHPISLKATLPAQKHETIDVFQAAGFKSISDNEIASLRLRLSP